VADQKVAAVPFRKATLKKRTLLNSYALGAALGGRNSWDIDSKGYLASLRFMISGTETTTTADPVANADFPWNVVLRHTLRDSSGGMLINLKGYSAYLAQQFFKPVRGNNVAYANDTRVYAATISAVAVNTQAWSYDLQVEAGTRDNLGLVPNQNATFRYQLSVDFDVEANLVTTPANSVWALSAQPQYQYYSVPAPVRPDKVPQQTTPPFFGVVRQQFDESQVVPSAAENRYNLAPGRVIRNLILVTRNAAGVRTNGISRLKFMYGDDTLLFDMTEQDLLTEFFQLYNDNARAGIYVVCFTADSDGFAGADYRRDLVDTRRLSQCYLLATTYGAITTMDIIHDELIVPSNMAI